MCRIFKLLPPQAYAYQTRSLRLGGHATSIRLEARFWQILEEIARIQGTGLPKFVTTLHDEVLDRDGEVRNFASLLRCACLVYVSDVRDHDGARGALVAEASAAFAPLLAVAE